MAVYDYLDYRDWLSDEVGLLKAGGKTSYLLADAAGIQPTYLSRVLKKHSHLNHDQLYNVAKELKATDQQIRFAMLLLEYQRCSGKNRQKWLRQEIEVVLSSHESVKEYIRKDEIIDSAKASTFYLDPELRVVYSLLALPRFRKVPEEMATCLRVTKGKIQEHLRTLIDLGFLVEGTKGYEKVFPNIHMDKEIEIYQSSQLLLKYRALQQLQLLEKEKQHNFNVLFTADRATKKKIYKEFLKFIQSTEKLVEKARSEHVYHMQFDLFGWSE